MTLSEYVGLTLILVANQARLVEECGYCIGWNGDLEYYDSVKDYTEAVRMHIENSIADGSLITDISVEHAMELYRL